MYKNKKNKKKKGYFLYWKSGVFLELKENGGCSS